MIEVYIRYYADLAIITGTAQEKHSLEAGETISALIEELRIKHTGLAEKELFLTTLNGSFVPITEYGNVKPADQDQVNFYPAAQGG